MCQRSLFSLSILQWARLLTKGSSNHDSDRTGLIIDTNDIVRVICGAAIDKKASDLVVLNLEGKTSYADLFILCNGGTNRQVKAISEGILAKLKEMGAKGISTEGLGSARWVLIDTGDVIVHVFEEHLRGYYDLDGLWVDAKCVPLESFGFDTAVISEVTSPYRDSLARAPAS